MSVLEYLTEHRGMIPVSCVTCSASVIYHFKVACRKKQLLLTVDLLADQRVKVTLEDETRIVPPPAEIKALLKEPGMEDSTATIRILSQVLDMLLKKHRGEVEGAVADKMERHARQKI